MTASRPAIASPQRPLLSSCANVFRALSDETRLGIYLLLGDGELCVCQIQVALALSQTKVSRHLSVLRHAGLVHARRDGQWMYYSRVDPDHPSIARFTRALCRLLDANPDLVGEVASGRRYDALSMDDIAQIARDL